MSEQGRKFDGGKLRYDLLPVMALEDVVKGLTYGTIKYDDNNWVKVPEGRKRYIAAAMRHIEKYRLGVLFDEESGVHHLSAAIDNLMFIVEKDLRGWEDVSEENIPEKTEDISQEALKMFISGLTPEYTISLQTMETPTEEEKLWYPPVEEGENPWIEYDGSGRPVSGEQFVEVLLKDEREYENFTSMISRARYWDWDDTLNAVVAYRLVNV